MANIYKRGQIWWGRVQKDGKEYRASLKTRSESDARKSLAEWEARLNELANGGKPRLTLNEVLDHFILEHVATLRPTHSGATASPASGTTSRWATCCCSTSAPRI